MKVKRMVFLSILLSLAVIVGYLETLIPPIGIPGVKLGLANIIILITIYNFKSLESFIIMLLRVVIVSFLIGTFFTIPFFMSLTGGLFSFTVMLGLKKINKLSIIGVSIAGAFSHSVGQIIIAIIVMQTATIAYYFPLIILISIPTGFLVGLVCYKLNKLDVLKTISDNKSLKG